MHLIHTRSHAKNIFVACCLGHRKTEGLRRTHCIEHPTLLPEPPQGCEHEAALRPFLYKPPVTLSDAQYSEQYRNPCWQDATGALRCLPYAYILGGFHSGVTSLAVKVRVWAKQS